MPEQTKIFDPAQLTSTKLLRGEVVGASWQVRESNFNGQTKQKETLVLDVTNLDRPDLQKPVGVFIDYSDKKPSKWSYFLEALLKVGVTLTTGPEQLIGQKFVFDEITIDFGPDRSPNAPPGKRIAARQRVPVSRI